MTNGTIAFDTLSTSGQIDGTARSIDTDFLLNGCAKSYTFATAAAVLSGDSFNITSGTDDGTGDYSFVFTNNLSTGNTVYHGTIFNSAMGVCTIAARATTGYDARTFNDANTATDQVTGTSAYGVLA